jgi:hypothetical protein
MSIYKISYYITAFSPKQEISLGIETLGLTASLVLLFFGMIIMFILIRIIKNKS